MASSQERYYALNAIAAAALPIVLAMLLLLLSHTTWTGAESQDAAVGATIAL